MISERTRLCPLCRTILPETGPSACPSCSRLTAPPLADWPVFLRLWLMQKQLEAFGAPFIRGTAQHRWERLLVNVIAGRQWQGRIYPRATDAADCWPVAMDEARKWEASGCPPLFG